MSSAQFGVDRKTRAYGSLQRLASGGFEPADADKLRREMSALLSGLSSSNEDEVNSQRDVGRLARAAFRHLSRGSTQKQLGQFLTPRSVAALTCAAAINSQNDVVIDPTCGDGEMLWAGFDRLERLGCLDPTVVGIEIDELAAQVAGIPPDASGRSSRPKVIAGDTFLEVAGRSGSGASHLHAYDAVVGNPPYIRYQDIASQLHRSSPEVVEAFRRLNCRASGSQLVSSIVRASLVSHLVPAEVDFDDFARRGSALLIDPSSIELDPVDRCWVRMVAGLSGLADLSAALWLQSWLLAKPGGLIGYVTTNSFRKREYGRLLRYFMVRFLQPVLVLEQEGNGWFQNAQVTTALMVFRARPRTEIAGSNALGDSSANGLHVRVARDRNLSDMAEFCRIGVAESASVAAERILESVRSRVGSVPNWAHIYPIDEVSWLNQVLHEDSLSLRGSVKLIDGELAEQNSDVSVCSRASSRETYVAPALAEILSLDSSKRQGWRSLSQCGVQVNQGLRTGCNPFFYVQRVSDGDVVDLTDGALRSPVLDDPSHEAFRLSVVLLKRKGLIVPASKQSVRESWTIVRLSSVFDRRLALFPTRMLFPAIRRQSGLDQWRVDRRECRDLVLVAGASARREDLGTLAGYPKEWLATWKSRDGLVQLAESVSAYIDLGEEAKIEGKAGVSLVPQLSAVGTNHQQPRLPASGMPLAECPRAPRWWYTLSIQPRHVGRIFINRVVNQSPMAFLNDSTPALVDANFSTLTPQTSDDDMAWFAFLNSVWSIAWLETASAPMGGGALKVEAAHLRQLLVPRFTDGQWVRMCELGARLSNSSLMESGGVLAEIDRCVASALTEDPARAEEIAGELRSLAARSRTQRKRSPKSA